MEETKKRDADEQEVEGGDTAAAKKKPREAVPVAEGEEETREEDVMAWLVADEINGEFSADELRKLLGEEEEEETSVPMAGNEVIDASGMIEIEDSEAWWCRTFRVRFIDDPYTTPPVVFQSSSGYVTINGNEESCGSSFSDSDASVMASVDASGLFGIAGYFSSGSGAEAETTVAQGEGSGAWDSSEAEASSYGIIDAVGRNGWDAFDQDDGLLARFLGEDRV